MGGGRDDNARVTISRASSRGKPGFIGAGVVVMLVMVAAVVGFGSGLLAQAAPGEGDASVAFSGSIGMVTRADTTKAGGVLVTAPGLEVSVGPIRVPVFAAPHVSTDDAGRLLTDVAARRVVGWVLLDSHAGERLHGSVVPDFAGAAMGAWTVWSETGNGARARGIVMDVDGVGGAVVRGLGDDGPETRSHCDCDCCDDWWDDCGCSSCGSCSSWRSCSGCNDCCDCCDPLTPGEVVAVVAVVAVAAAISECSVSESGAGGVGVPLALLALGGAAVVMRRRVRGIAVRA